jgi:hypothetical protein
MTSTVTNYSSLIDVTYPVAGVDNDTQGFRDNFTSIKGGLDSLGNEISDLQLQLNNATTTSTAFATSIASTVTTRVLNTVSSFLSTSTTYAVAAPTTSKGGNGDIKGMVFATTAAVYVCYSTWAAPGTADIWAKVATVGKVWP